MIAAIPAGFLPVAYALLAINVLIAAFFGGDIRSGESSVLWWIGMVAIWLTLIQWPFYFLWVGMSRELLVKQKIAWMIIIFIGNMFAIPYFLWCKYRNNAASLTPCVASRSDIAIRLVTGLIIGLGVLGLFYMSLLNMMWKSEALISSEFAAKLWAANDFSKGRIVQLRLVITDEPKRTGMKPTMFEGPYVVREWVGYIDPLLKDTNSPSIQVARKMVEVYNATMKEIFENPEEYRKRLDREIAYWQTNVLGKTEASKASEITARKLIESQR